MAIRLKAGSANARLANRDSDVENVTANGALSRTRGISRLAGSGALTLTLAAPLPGTRGFKKKITNTVAQTAALTVTGMDGLSTADVFSFAVASATARPTLELEVINVAADGSAESLKWYSGPLGAGVTVA